MTCSVCEANAALCKNLVLDRTGEFADDDEEDKIFFYFCEQAANKISSSCTHPEPMALAEAVREACAKACEQRRDDVGKSITAIAVAIRALDLRGIVGEK